MALTEGVGSNLKAKFGAIRTYTVGATSGAIYEGATVVLRQDGYAYPAAEDTADANKQLVVGWALESAAAGETVRVRRDGTLSRLFPGVDQSAIGKLALVKDDETVHTYSVLIGKIIAGRIASIDVEGESVYVDFTDRPARIAASLND
jgi:hypothetical protein